MAAVAERVRPSGLTIFAPGAAVPEDLSHKLRRFNPRGGLGQIIRDMARRGLPADMAGELIERISRMVVIESELFGVHIDERGQRDVLGVLSRKLITDAGVGFLVDAWQNIVELEDMKYHGYGTGTNAEAQGNTALQTELTTQYATDNTRPTGSTTEGASANIFRSVATLSPNAGGTIAVTEHGLFSQASNAGGVLWDRSVFSAINVVASADSLQTTYDMTASAGG